MKDKEIFFYIPALNAYNCDLLLDSDSYWNWLCEQESISPMQSGGNFWTLQTYLNLKENGFLCQLVDTIPDEGIIISHRDYLNESLKPKQKQLFVCLRADTNRHPFAQLHVVQNSYQAIPRKLLTLWESHYISHWAQPSLIPRDSSRGDTFENITFAGNSINLVAEFKSEKWYQQLEKMGLKFNQQLTHKDWNNYKNTDLILAIRNFGKNDEFCGKPASKLYNAWLAGVPAILGYESAFRYERKNKLDYIEATTYEEVITALKLLKEDKDLRKAMVENGFQRAKEVSREEIAKKWESFLVDVAVPAYEKWCNTPRWQQQIFLLLRSLFVAVRPAYYLVKSKLLKR